MTMRLLASLTRKKSRRLFLAFFILASLLPLLVMIFITSYHLKPLLLKGEIAAAEVFFSYGLAAMLFLSLVSSLLMFRWLHILENTTSDIQHKSAHLTRSEPAEDLREENEIHILLGIFDNMIQTLDHESSEHRRMKEVLSNVIAMSCNLTAELDSDRLFPVIIQKVTEAMKAERTSLYMIDYDQREIWTKVAEGIQQIRLPLGHGISGRVAETGATVNVRNARDLSYFLSDFDAMHNFMTRSVLCVPIHNSFGERIAVIQVINKKDQSGFDSDDELLLRALASQVGIALENSFLLDEVKLTFESLVRSLAATVDARHPFTAGHSQRVTAYSLLIAKTLHLSENEMEVLKYAALLHDIGKIGISDQVLLKNGVYTEEERAEMETHALKTRGILDKFHFPKALRDVPKIAACHHERVNGRGYPEGLAGDLIPLGSMIIAVADVFDALTSRRDYPKYTSNKILDCDPIPLAEAISILKKGVGIQFEPDVVKAFLHCLPEALLLYRGDHFPPHYIDKTIFELAPEKLPSC